MEYVLKRILPSGASQSAFGDSGTARSARTQLFQRRIGSSLPVGRSVSASA